MRSPILSLQAATKQRAVVKISKYPVFDGVPQNEPINYISLGDYDFDNQSDKTTDRMEISHIITCWSKFNGTDKVCEMLDELMKTLDGWCPDLSEDGFQVQFNRWQRGRISRANIDGKLYRYGTITFSYKIKDLQ